MEQNLVGYLLNALDPEMQREVDRYLRDHPGARRHLDLLRTALAPLESDREGIEPPPGLVVRTLATVAEHQCRNRPARPERENGPPEEEPLIRFPLPRELPPAPKTPTARHFGPDRRWWRRADVLVAAALVLAILGIGLPGVGKARFQEQLRACQNNLRGFHQDLVAYASSHKDNFPRIEEAPPHNVAGAFVQILYGDDQLPSGRDLHCPGNADGLPGPAADRSTCYAYPLGYLDGQNRLQGLRRNPNQAHNDLLPLMADRPNPDRIGSPNHGGGMNVLYVGGHAWYRPHPAAGVNNDHIFLNSQSKVAAGDHAWDTVLGAGADHP